MLPIRQTVPVLTTPVVNRGLIASHIVIFVAQLFLGPWTERVISTFGFVPARLLDPAAFHYQLWESVLTLFTSPFLHGGVVHLLGNLVFLYVFGSAVEESLGSGRYFLFYLACGATGSLMHTLLFPSSVIPSIGASGSIAGVLGIFLVLRPAARIVTLFPLVISWAMAEVPAILFMPVWFATQFFNGYLSLRAARATQEVAGIAWWAHVGGFLAGMLVGALLRSSGRPVGPESGGVPADAERNQR